MNTKDRIIKVSTDCFAKYGYEGVTINLLLKKLQINKSTFYYYFKSKKELFEEIIKLNFDLLITKLQQNLSNNKTPQEKISIFIDIMCKRERKDVLLIIREIIDGGENFSEELLNLFVKFQEILFSILKEGKEKKIFKKDNLLFTMYLIIGISDFYKISKPFSEKFKELSNYQDIDEKECKSNLEKIVLNYLKDE